MTCQRIANRCSARHAAGAVGHRSHTSYQPVQHAVDQAIRLVDINLIDIAPLPALTGLEGLDHWMIGSMEMFGCMLILRRVAAANMTADQAQPQVDPGIATLQTLLTTLCTWRHLVNLIKMCTLCHALPRSLSLYITRAA